MKEEIRIPAAVKDKKFPEKAQVARQVTFLLYKKGPMTTWELVDALNKRRSQDTTYRTVQKAVRTMQNQKLVLVVNWKEEKKRHKEPKRDRYRWNYRPADHNRVGKPSGGVEDVPVWALANNASEDE